MKNFLVAFDKCKGSLSATELCNLSEKILSKRFKGSKTTKIPLTDGGEGFSQILTESVTGNLLEYDVKDSLGGERNITLGVCEIQDLNLQVARLLKLPEKGKLAIVEMAQAAGLADLTECQRNPWQTSTFGVGQMLRQAALLEVDAILLGIGGSSTNDAGLGAMAALGARFINDQGHTLAFPKPSDWKTVHTVDCSKLMDLPSLYIACDVDNTLLGKNGATSQYGPQKGLPVSQISQFEDEMIKILGKLKSCFPQAMEKSRNKGSGAAGGLGFGLSLSYDVSLLSGFELVSKWFDIKQNIQNADFVITGEGRFDMTSLNGKGPFEILRLASENRVPSLVMAGSVERESIKHVLQNLCGCDIIPFGREDWSLDKNLSLAEECFSKSLSKYNFQSPKFA